MTKRRMLLTLLSLILLVSVLSACGGSNGNTSNTGEQGGSAANTGDKTKQPEPVTLTMWVTSREQDDFGAQMEKEFLNSHPHITFNKVVKEGDPGNEFYQAVAAGNAPDFVEVSFTMMDKYMKAGIVEPLNNYVGQWDEWSNFNKTYVDMFTVDSKVLGIPTKVSPMLFGYNKALFAKAGITELPKTWDEALEVAKKINDPSGQVSGYATLAAEWTEWFFQYYVWQAGGDLTKQNADGSAELTFTGPAVIKAAEYYKQLRANKVLQSDLTLKFDNLIEKFAQGKIGMMPFAGDWVSWAISLGMKPEDIGLMLPPAGPSGQTATAIGGSTYVINAKTAQAQKDAAWEYIKFLSSKDYMTKFYQNVASKGAGNPVVMVRDDLNINDFFNFPEEYAGVLKSVTDIGRLEFYGKADFGVYVDRAVQKLLTDPNADPTKEFEAAQKLAASEVLDSFNEKSKQ
ncbi:extracellular solute-binding protein [Paenibacillus sp. LHD-38]|uniref:extracellular solute-binding protein n=1 Tax=Paenibacillus sp. LHD-38 TaxID=3072143 RepID=UPI00280D74D4|nr:extracellular solute-binding protein [Paenibacillus sp. LHD-38]MDQ8735201.1 extracellular solute-binding protein [Paenibacillus sp. LHD-38]